MDGRRILAGVALAPDQRARLHAMRAELDGAREELTSRRIAAAARGADYGPDSPQMMDMQMEMAGIESDAGRLQRRFSRRIFLELLTPSQVVEWVLAARD
jgi:hypothetical protein